VDDGFRRRLLADPDSVREEYGLSEVQGMLLESLEEADLDKLTVENLDEYFAVDSAVYTPEGVAELDRNYRLADQDIASGVAAGAGESGGTP
jgi:hypothetical protein